MTDVMTDEERESLIEEAEMNAEADRIAYEQMILAGIQHSIHNFNASASNL